MSEWESWLLAQQQCGSEPLSGDIDEDGQICHVRVAVSCLSCLSIATVDSAAEQLCPNCGAVMEE